MASEFDQTEFVDTDFTPSKLTEDPRRASDFRRPPSREELETRVTEAQQKLVELKRAQEELERERAALEEARRRRAEYQNGRQEMLQHLTRGIGLLEQAEFNARRDAEQMSKSLADMRAALEKVQGLNEELWTQENWSRELTAALTTLENARMEWNSAQMKWPLLSGDQPASHRAPEGRLIELAELSFAQLARMGLALTWPVALAALGAGAAVVLVLLRK